MRIYNNKKGDFNMKQEITEEKRAENRKFMNKYMSTIVSVLCMYIFGYVGSVFSRSGNVFSAMVDMLNELTSFHLAYPINVQAILGMITGMLGGLAYYFFADLHDQRLGTYKLDEVAGSARFMTNKEIKEYTKENIEELSSEEANDIKKEIPSMIMSNKFRRPMNSRKLIGNNNVLVVGGAGTGKSRFFIKPNVLQMNASYVITDPSGEMIFSLGRVLQEGGYKIKIFNIADMAYSNCYNPLAYIRDEAGVNMLIDCFIKNTTTDGSKGDEFFTNAEKLLYSACIFYLKDHCTDESKKNFSSVINMVNSSAVDENNPNEKSPLDKLFDQLPKDSLAWKNYKAFKQAAGRTLKSIIISCVTRLRPFLTPQVANITKTDNLELEKMGDEKTALFIITPQADRTYAFLASMLYSQLFETLYYKCEQQKKQGGSEQLKIPVRCLMDEFANIGEVPEFPSKLATMRKYNISASIILQDISQIEAMYKEEWKTLVGNCSTIVFLGTQEPNTLKYFSDMLGKATVKNSGRGINHGSKSSSSQNINNAGRELRFADELGRMHSKKCIVFTQNMHPVEDLKYRYERHARYKLTADYDNNRGYLYSKMPIYNNQALPSFDNILKAKSEAARIRKEDLVTNPKNLKEAKTEMSKEEAFNDLQFEEKIIKSAYLENVTKSQEMLIEMKNQPIAIAKLESVPLNQLERIARQNYAFLNEKPIILFSDIHEKNHLITGFVFCNNDSIFDVVVNQYVKYNKRINDYLLIRVNSNRLEEFKEEVIAKMLTVKVDTNKETKILITKNSDNTDDYDVNAEDNNSILEKQNQTINHENEIEVI